MVDQLQQEMDENREPVRLSKLREVLSKALSHVALDVSEQDFAECFPDYAARNAPALSELRQDLLTQLKENVMGEFERIAGESRLKNKFNELERIMEEQPISLQTGQPRSYIPFDPKTLTGTKILQEKEKKRDELVTKLEKIEQENALLNEKIQKQQERARRILSVIEGNTATVEATARLCINQKTVD